MGLKRQCQPQFRQTAFVPFSTSGRARTSTASALTAWRRKQFDCLFAAARFALTVSGAYSLVLVVCLFAFLFANYFHAA